ncbi:MAG: hypothetical protein OXI01_15285 [Albidovulum sp.]|nr:hypothetical protein [Albidovulum sp.]
MQPAAEPLGISTYAFGRRVAERDATTADFTKAPPLGGLVQDTGLHLPGFPPGNLNEHHLGKRRRQSQLVFPVIPM